VPGGNTGTGGGGSHYRVIAQVAKVAKVSWLGDEDSNLGVQIQSLLSYH
jgi:hypothetical protein